MSGAASTGIGLLLRARLVVDGRRGRVGPVVASRDRYGAIERSHVPVDVRGPLPPVAATDGDLPAMILGTFRRVQRPPERGIGDAVDLTTDDAPDGGTLERAGIGAEVDEPSAHLPLAHVLGPPGEEPMQAEAAHQR